MDFGFSILWTKRRDRGSGAGMTIAALSFRAHRRAGGLSASSESESAPAVYSWSHFLRKTGVHFSGKCSTAISPAIPVAGAFKHLLLGWIGRRILTRAIDELRAMDDQTLAGVGLERSEIEAARRFGRRWLQRSMVPRRETAGPR
jgi:hypothetical protein